MVRALVRVPRGLVVPLLVVVLATGASGSAAPSRLATVVGQAIDVPLSTPTLTARVYEDGVVRSSWTCVDSAVNLSLSPTFDELTSPDHVALGQITQLAVAGCYLPGGVVMTFTLTQPGAVVATSGLVDAVGQARIEGVGLRVQSQQCSFNVAGGADVDVDLSQRVVTSVDEPTTLVVSGVTGCLGQVLNGNELRLVGTFSIT
jgi:hypothetical protein